MFKPAFSYFKNRRARRMDAKIRAIPVFDFEKKHVEDCLVLPGRRELLEHLPRGTAAEMGVDQGEFSQQILDIAKPHQLYLIDLWGTTRYGEDKAQQVQQKFADQIATGSVKILRGLSTVKLAEIEDASLDWVYIDTNHRYSTTLEELRLAEQKLRPGGVIAGHDFVDGNLRKSLKYGVIEAVTQFCVENDWRLALWTANFSEKNSFALKKI